MFFNNYFFIKSQIVSRGARGYYSKQLITGKKEFETKVETNGISVPILLVGNKVDLLNTEQAKNSESVLKQKVDEMNYTNGYLISSKTAYNVDIIMNEIVHLILENQTQH
ncbi:hypothetical protein EIN_508730 [Entamoeba invadens IP1]|uniref:Uncharacterized protein n=1 Tax=Entamoeba invadens IP1 TaxID=370355 RepID=A0A0A1UCB0_ENTIV|nr:hypothetical protein EIN_508730 [Entamoeba invadens IP1]ELP92872.1 hypothetical protein EIN_508730 [Entamoeba invadens IP1]|eukprot:XP_004259643.1 hypothetical protein EIN_508730 [Entamoeba invadens IP1]